MESIKEQQAEWARYRQRLEREIRVLVVDGDEATRKQLDKLLYRCHIPARTVASGQQALEMVGREHYSVLITAEQLDGMRGLALTRQVRVSHPDVDVIVSTWEPTVELMTQAFEFRLLDVLVKPFSDEEEIGNRIKEAVRRNVDRRMRQYVLSELRSSLEQIDSEARLRTTAALDRRLSAYKNSLGDTERLLVVEEQPTVRLISESLLLAGLAVETADFLEEGIKRVVEGDLFLVVVDEKGAAEPNLELISKLRTSDPQLEIAFIALEPTVEGALSAMRAGVSAFVPWPLLSPMSSVALRLRDIIRRARQSRLVDNLFVELYRETTEAFGEAVERDFAAFRTLIGLPIAQLPTPAKGIANARTAQELDAFLSDVLADLDAKQAPLEEPQAADDFDPNTDDRREHTRVPDSQFVRFRERGAASSTLAYLGDLSVGGAFVRTSMPVKRGAQLEVDINAEYQQQRYSVFCRAQVAWVSDDDRASVQGPGFGVEFLTPPDDVKELLDKMIDARQRELEIRRTKEVGVELETDSTS